MDVLPGPHILVRRRRRGSLALQILVRAGPQTLGSGDAIEFMIAREKEDMLEALTLDLEELKVALVILQSTDITSKN